MERDPNTGRFLPGNKIAVGNSGNRHPKYGNKNAMKHGLYASFTYAIVRNDGNLWVFAQGKQGFVISPKGFIRDEDGSIRIRDDIATKLEEYGHVFE